MGAASERASRGKSNGALRGALRSRSDDVMEDFAELRKDVGRLYEAAGDAAVSEFQTVKTRLDRLSAELRDQASDRAEYVVEQIRERPYAAMGISLGIGLLIGALISPRR